MSFVSAATIHKLRDFLTKSTETCMNMTERDGSLKPIIQSITRGESGVCLFPLPLTEVLLHIHPMTLPPYPSRQDLNYPVRHPEVRGYVIVTRLGTWVISADPGARQIEPSEYDKRYGYLWYAYKDTTLGFTSFDHFTASVRRNYGISAKLYPFDVNVPVLRRPN